MLLILAAEKDRTFGAFRSQLESSYSWSRIKKLKNSLRIEQLNFGHVGIFKHNKTRLQVSVPGSEMSAESSRDEFVSDLIKVSKKITLPIVSKKSSLADATSLAKKKVGRFSARRRSESPDRAE